MNHTPKFFKILLLGLLILVYCRLHAQNLLELKSEKNETYIGKSLETYIDKTNSLTFKGAIESKLFNQSTSRVPNFGVSSNSNWIRFNLINKSDENKFIVRLALATIDYVDYYVIYENGNIDSIKTGDCRPFANRELDRPDFIFKLNLNKNQIVNILFKLKGGEQVQAPIFIGNETDILESFFNEDTLTGIYFGVILVMILYNLFIFFSIKDKNYLFYVAYILIVGLTQINFTGYAYKYLWSNSIYISNMAVYILSSLVAISAMEFMKRFLSTKEKAPQYHKCFIVFYIIYYIALLLALFRIFDLSYQIIQINAMLAASFMIFVALKISRQGYRPAKYFIVAWSTFLVGVCIFVFKDFGILPYNNFTHYTMQIGSAFEVVLLSFALADRINILTIEKQQSQIKMVSALQENEKLITEQNIILEQKVNERTIELSTTLINLKEAQEQLVSAEKMASIGQLTAGIAHEINNPINFVSANLKPLKMDISEILEVIKKYEAIKSHDILEDKLKEVEAYKKEIDLNYLKQEIEILLSGIEDGAKRTTEIVSGLKNFSRLDETDVKECNINEGIESTLTLLKHAIPKNVDVIVNLGKIPPIECLPGKLNQVFMNLLTNALYAIKKKGNTDKNKLTITTYLEGEYVCASFEDSGIGMTKEIKNKIFDPFFTTKDVGEGTGLGMSIVFKIIKTHHAKIEVDTEYGKGTKIVLTLNRKIDL